jgi:hypothetical protein
MGGIIENLKIFKKLKHLLDYNVFNLKPLFMNQLPLDLTNLFSS